MDTALERILAAANQAPSGENCQPWRFVVSGLTVEIHVRPERDQSYYGWGQRASYLACGAALENLVIASSKEGYAANVSYFPDKGDAWHVATVTLRKDASAPRDVLADFIYERISNRKPYATEPLTQAEEDTLHSAAVGSRPGSLKLVKDKEAIAVLGRVGSTNEEVMLANRALHDFFFSHVTWTKEEDDAKKIGFYIKTLELPPPAEKMFKMFNNWSVMRILAKLGFNRIVAKQNGATNASAAAMGAFIIDGTEPIDFVKVGRAVERTWLAATSLGLSFQPLTGVLFFKLKIAAGESDMFTTAEQRLVMTAYGKASQIFNADGKHIAFMFRIGRADPPTAHALRFPLEEAVSIV
ncbi:MAG TPA: hypothetical protein VMV50_01055 [Candidatus Paceibacterota bacterium]|nr:hypothetical protein [Candidatus Paceibacterota bacterium]